MSNDNILPTSLEHLPTEIFLQIFALLPLQEIVTAFYGLNFYIDSIIRLTRTTSHTVRYNDAAAINTLYFFPTQIIRLIVVNVEIADLTSLTNLRSLTLKYGTEEQFNSIRPQHFPMLEILHIKGIHTAANGNTETMTNLFQVLLSNGFPRLRICTAFDTGALSFSDTWTGSPALRFLNLSMKTTRDYEQIRSACPHLRRLTTYTTSMGDPPTGPHAGIRRRIFSELRSLERLESENKFIIDVNRMASFGNNEPPPRFNNTRASPCVDAKDIHVIQGRILPQTEPYCQASFLVEIKLSLKYPFEQPDVRFLDPIYHPNVNESGRHCCCWGFSLYEMWKPTTKLSDIIMAVIHIIDKEPDEHTLTPERFEEYRIDYLKFYKKALKFTLSNGRPRY